MCVEGRKIELRSLGLWRSEPVEAEGCVVGLGNVGRVTHCGGIKLGVGTHSYLCVLLRPFSIH